MWLFTEFGFFSVVQKPDDKKASTLTIRSRQKHDLEQLRERHLPGMGPITANAGSDYKYRAKAPRAEVGLALANLATNIDYANFKDRVHAKQGKARAQAYGQVWHVLYSLQEKETLTKDTASGQSLAEQHAASLKASSASGLKRAYGGLLVDEIGRVLLREPKNHFDGYVWTFPKGRPDSGESPEEAALREVREETGYAAKIRAKLPCTFDGGTSTTEMFVMEPVGTPGQFDAAETASIEWASLDEARTLIKQTTNAKGRARDLMILEALADFLAK